MLTDPNVSTMFNEPYAKIPGDFNPIHINLYFSDLASLPATITHGCGQALPLADMLRLWSQRVTQIASLCMFSYLDMFVLLPNTP